LNSPKLIHALTNGKGMKQEKYGQGCRCSWDKGFICLAHSRKGGLLEASFLRDSFQLVAFISN
jgi:hypothetical protein